MLFNSLPFFVFALVVFSLWPLVRVHPKLRLAFLIAASFFFYGWWDARFILVLLFSGFVDFGAALWMSKRRDHARLALSASVIANLLVLALFKYPPFFMETSNALFGTTFDTASVRETYLPVGISFFTFQSMSYTIDVYRGRLDATRDPLLFFSYLSLFPQLVAGPIVRARDLLPQLRAARPVTGRDWWDGLGLIARGYFKKVVLADQIAPFVDQAFASPTLPDNTAYWWVVVVLFGIQIYGDFSGYSDIAIGLGRWFGLRFPENFQHPYLASGFRDFWTRWHISLSTWFRDYVYIPLGGSKRGAARSHVNLWVTMLLSGLWHGASWRYLVWGALHAAFVSFERVTGWSSRLARWPLGRALSVFLVFAAVSFAWGFFRAESLDQALEVSRYLLRPSTGMVPEALRPGLTEGLCAGVFVLMELAVAFRLMERFQRRSPRAFAISEAALVGVTLAASLLLRGPGHAFIYFQF
jgi:D-alanyl-lipoteichoic acid acyltransferase DltB (MBOAT superfamily)